MKPLIQLAKSIEHNPQQAHDFLRRFVHDHRSLLVDEQRATFFLG